LFIKSHYKFLQLYQHINFRKISEIRQFDGLDITKLDYECRLKT